LFTLKIELKALLKTALAPFQKRMLGEDNFFDLLRVQILI
jgi:hypothetical protein